MNLRHIIVKSAYRFLGKYFPKTLASIRYQRIFGKKLNWENPTNLNEKINWLKFYSDTSQWSILADKYLVREYIEQKGLGDILVKLYGKWEDVEQIDWNKLPNSFVLKMNNGSGDIIVCKDKSSLDIEETKALFKKLIKKTFGYTTAEPHYTFMKPCIIAEELLYPVNQATPSTSIIDYKIWCFDGKPESVWACRNRTKTTVEVASYDLDWNHHPEHSVYTSHYMKSSIQFNRPKSLDRMLEIASILSEGFPQVRVDLYEVDNKVYFGELTFTSNFGMMEFYSDEYLNYLGEKVKLTNLK